MNIKMIVGLFLILVAGGFMLGCIEAPTVSDEVKEFEVVKTIPTPTKVEEVVFMPEVIEVVEVIEVIRYEEIEPEMQVIEIVYCVDDPEYYGDEYYTYQGEQQYIALLEVLGVWEIPGKPEYNIDVFDCSEMTAMYEMAFENAGHHAKICIGYQTEDYRGGHAWVAVEVQPEQWEFYEATTDSWYVISNPCNSHPYYLQSFEYIWEAEEFSPSEFDWWDEVI